MAVFSQGNSATVVETVQQKTSKVVEDELLTTQLFALYKFKILLLGAGESGKSTMAKQFNALHRPKHKQTAVVVAADDYEYVIDALHENTFVCMRSLLDAARRFGFHLEDDRDRYGACR